MFSSREYDTEEVRGLIVRARSVECAQGPARSRWFKWVLALQLAFLVYQINRLRLRALREHVRRLWGYDE